MWIMLSFISPKLTQKFLSISQNILWKFAIKILTSSIKKTKNTRIKSQNTIFHINFKQPNFKFCSKAFLLLYSKTNEVWLTLKQRKKPNILLFLYKLKKPQVLDKSKDIEKASNYQIKTLNFFNKCTSIYFPQSGLILNKIILYRSFQIQTSLKLHYWLHFLVVFWGQIYLNVMFTA